MMHILHSYSSVEVFMYYKNLSKGQICTGANMNDKPHTELLILKLYILQELVELNTYCRIGIVFQLGWK